MPDFTTDPTLPPEPLAPQQPLPDNYKGVHIADTKSIDPFESFVQNGKKNLPIWASPNSIRMSVPYNTRLDQTLRYTDPNLGFTPLDPNLEDEYANAHPIATFRNNIVQGGARFLGAAAESIATIPLFFNAAIKGDVSKLYNNDFTNGIDDFLKALDTELPVYQTNYERDHPIAKYFAFWKPTAFAGSLGSVINNMGFMAGAIAGSLVEDAAITALTGGVGLFPALAGNAAFITKLSRSARALAEEPQQVLALTKLANTTDDLLPAITSDAAVMARTEGGAVVRSTGDNISTQAINANEVLTSAEANRIAKSIVNSDKYYKIRNAVKYNLALLSSGMAIGAFQSVDIYHRSKDELAQRYYDLNGTAPQADDLRQIEEISKQSANIAMGANVALTYLTARLNFGSLFKPTQQAFDEEMITGSFGNIGKSKIERAALDKANNFKYSVVTTAPETKIGKILLNGKKLGNKLALSAGEGFQFLSMGSITETGLDYSLKKYDAENRGEVANYMDSFLKGVNNNLTTNEGISNIMLGVVMGLFGTPLLNRVKAGRGYISPKDQMNRIVEILNSSSLKPVIDGAVVQSGLAKEHKVAVDAKDEKTARDIREAMLENWVITASKTNAYEARVEELEAVRDLEGKSFESYWNMEDNAANRQKINEFIDNTKRKAARINENFNRINRLTKNPFNAKTQPEDYHAYETYKEQLAVSLSRSQDKQERLKAVSNKLSELTPGLDIQNAVDLTTIGGLRNIAKKLDSAVTEVSKQIQAAEEAGTDKEVVDNIRKQHSDLNDLFKRTQEMILDTKVDENGNILESGFNGEKYVSVLQDLYKLHTGGSFTSNKYLDEQRRLSDGKTFHIEENNKVNSSDELANALQDLQDIYALGRDNLNVQRMYNYLRSGKGAQDYIEMLRAKILDNQRKFVNNEGEIKTIEELHNEIEEETRFDQGETFNMEEATKPQRDAIRIAAKKVVNGEELTSAEQHLSEQMPNRFANEVKIQELTKKKIDDRFGGESVDGTISSSPNHAINVKDIFGMFSPSSNSAEHRNNLYNAIFKDTDVVNKLTARYDKPTSEAPTTYTNIPNTKLYRSTFVNEDTIGIYHDGKAVGVLRPPTSMWLDAKGNRSIFDLKEGEYKEVTGNDPSTYKEFMQSLTDYQDAYNKLRNEMKANPDRQFTYADINKYFDLTINAGSSIQNRYTIQKTNNKYRVINPTGVVVRTVSTEQAAKDWIVQNNNKLARFDTLLKDLNYKPKGTALVSFIDTVSIVGREQVSKKSKQGVIVNRDELTPEQIAKLEVFLEENADMLSANINRYAVILPVGGEYVKKGILFARNAETTSENRSEYFNTLKEVASGSASADSSKTAMQGINEKYFLANNDRTTKQTFIVSQFDENGNFVLQINNPSLKVFKKISIPKETVQEVETYGDFINKLQGAIDNEAQNDKGLAKLQVELTEDSLKRQIPNDEQVKTLKQVENVLKVATSQNVFKNFNINFNPKNGEGAAGSAEAKPITPKQKEAIKNPEVRSEVDNINKEYAGKLAQLHSDFNNTLTPKEAAIRDAIAKDRALATNPAALLKVAGATSADLKSYVNKASNYNEAYNVYKAIQKQKIDNLTKVSKPVFAKTKEGINVIVKDLFGLNAEQAKAVAEIYDANAKAWAARTGNSVNDYYKQLGFKSQLDTEADILEQSPAFRQIADYLKLQPVKIGANIYGYRTESGTAGKNLYNRVNEIINERNLQDVLGARLNLTHNVIEFYPKDRQGILFQGDDSINNLFQFLRDRYNIKPEDDDLDRILKFAKDIVNPNIKRINKADVADLIKPYAYGDKNQYNSPSTVIDIGKIGGTDAELYLHGYSKITKNISPLYILSDSYLLRDAKNIFVITERPSNELFQGVKGAYDKLTNTIYALTSPDVTTPLHELAHSWEPLLTQAERTNILEWAKTKEWSTVTSEKFANGFEQYLSEGKAPTPELKSAFDKFADWLKNIVQKVRALFGNDFTLNDNMRNIYTEMLNGKAAVEPTVEAKVTLKEASSKEKAIMGENLYNVYNNTEEIGAIQFDTKDNEANVIHSVFLNEEYRNLGLGKETYIQAAIKLGDIKSGEFEENGNRTSSVSQEAENVWKSLEKQFKINKISTQNGKYRLQLTKDNILSSKNVSTENNITTTLAKNNAGDVYTFTIQNNNKEVGVLKAVNDGQYLTVNEANVTTPSQGVGIEAYRQAGEQAIVDGLQLRSDSIKNRLSEAAKGLWEKLVANGEAIKGEDNYIYTGKTLERTPNTEAKGFEESPYKLDPNSNIDIITSFREGNPIDYFVIDNNGKRIIKKPFESFQDAELALNEINNKNGFKNEEHITTPIESNTDYGKVRIVQKDIENGYYEKQIKEGKLTPDEVKSIIKSAGLNSTVVEGMEFRIKNPDLIKAFKEKIPTEGINITYLRSDLNNAIKDGRFGEAIRNGDIEINKAKEILEYFGINQNRFKDDFDAAQAKLEEALAATGQQVELSPDELNFINSLKASVDNIKGSTKNAIKDLLDSEDYKSILDYTKELLTDDAKTAKSFFNDDATYEAFKKLTGVTDESSTAADLLKKHGLFEPEVDEQPKPPSEKYVTYKERGPNDTIIEKYGKVVEEGDFTTTIVDVRGNTINRLTSALQPATAEQFNSQKTHVPTAKYNVGDKVTYGTDKTQYTIVDSEQRPRDDGKTFDTFYTTEEGVLISEAGIQGFARNTEATKVFKVRAEHVKRFNVLKRISSRFETLFPQIKTDIGYFDFEAPARFNKGRVEINLGYDDRRYTAEEIRAFEQADPNNVPWLKRESVAHEYMHPFIVALKDSNRVLYESLSKEIASNKEVMQQIDNLIKKGTYDESHRIDEGLAIWLGKEITKAFNKDGTFNERYVAERKNSLIHKFLQWMQDILNYLTGKKKTPPLEEFVKKANADAEAQLKNIRKLIKDIPALEELHNTRFGRDISKTIAFIKRNNDTASKLEGVIVGNKKPAKLEAKLYEKASMDNSPVYKVVVNGKDRFITRQEGYDSTDTTWNEVVKNKDGEWVDLQGRVGVMSGSFLGETKAEALENLAKESGNDHIDTDKLNAVIAEVENLGKNNGNNRFEFIERINENDAVEFDETNPDRIKVYVDPTFADQLSLPSVLQRYADKIKDSEAAREEFIDLVQRNFYTAGSRKVEESIGVGSINPLMKLQDVSDYIVKQLSDSEHAITYNENQLKYIDELTAYMELDNESASKIRERIVSRLKLLKDTADTRLNNETLRQNYNILHKLNLDENDTQFVIKYIQQGAVSINLAWRKFNELRDDLKDIEEISNPTIAKAKLNRLHKELDVIKQLTSFYDDFSNLYNKYNDEFLSEDMVKFDRAIANLNRIRDNMRETSIQLAIKWFMPYVEKHNEFIRKEGYTDPKYFLTEESLYNNFKYGTNKDTNFITFSLGPTVTSRDPVNAVFSNIVADMFNVDNVNIVNSVLDINSAFEKFAKEKGISVNNSKAQIKYYKDHYLRDAEILVSRYNEEKNIYEDVYVKKKALHQEFFFDKYEKDYAAQQAKYANPRSGDEAELFRERLNKWKQDNNFGRTEKYRNPEYAKLQNDQYFKLLEKHYNESNEKYGENKLQFGIVPQKYDANIVEEIKKFVEGAKNEKGAANKYLSLKEKAKESLAGLRKDQTSSNLDNTKYRRIKSNLNTLKNEENVDLNLHTTISDFITEATIYGSLKEVQYNAENLRMLIEGNTKFSIPARKIGQEDFEAKIRQSAQLRKAKIQLDELQSLKDAGKEYDVDLYDKLTKKIEKGVQSVTLWDKIAGTVKPSETNRLNEQLRQFINDSFYGESVEDMKLGTISLNKAARYISMYTSINSMAFNSIAGVSNIVIGDVQLLIEGNGGKYFNKKDLSKAASDYVKNIPQYMADLKNPIKSKDTQLSFLLDAIQGEVLDEFGNRISGNIAKRMFNTSSLFFFTSLGEHQIQITGMKAMLLGRKVQTESGQTISLYDAFIKDKDGRYSLRKDLKNFTADDLQHFIRQLHGVNRSLNGNYSDLHKSVLQRKWYGTLALKFRKYIYESFRTRFSSERVDYEKNTVDVGYLRYFLKDYLYNNARALLLKQANISDVKGNLKLKNLEPHQLYAVRKATMEIGIYLGISLITAALFGGTEKKDLTTAEKAILLYSLRLRNDLGMYHASMFSELKQQVKNPTASLTTALSLADTFGQLMSPNEVYKTNTRSHDAGDSKLLYDIKKLVPILSKFPINLDDKLSYFNLVNQNIEGVTKNQNAN